MTQEMFITWLLEHSIKSSVLLLAVLLLRSIIGKASIKVTSVLWTLVSIYVLIPVTVPSPFSIYMLLDTIGLKKMQGSSSAVYQIAESMFISNKAQGTNFTLLSRSAGRVLILIWIMGFLGMIIYGMIGLWRLKRIIGISLKQSDDIMICDEIDSPFIWGLFAPKIFLPGGLDINQTGYIIAHEKAHMTHSDQWRKPIAYLILCVYWFNPLFWLAFHLYCKDLEILCDKNAISGFSSSERMNYALTLVSYSTRKSPVLSSPLSFGEVAIKDRVEVILQTKEMRTEILRVYAILSILLISVFMTDPIIKSPAAGRNTVVFSDTTLSIKYEDALERAVSISEFSTLEKKLPGSEEAEKFAYKGSTYKYHIIEGITYYDFEIFADVVFSDRGSIEKTYSVRVNAVNGQATMLGWTLN